MKLLKATTTKVISSSDFNSDLKSALLTRRAFFLTQSPRLSQSEGARYTSRGKIFLKLLFTLILSLIPGELALASGFESPLLWSGRLSGMGGIATPHVSGAEALFFNPAGIVKSKPEQEVTFNLTSVASDFSAPINQNNEVIASKMKVVSPLSLLYGATPTEDYGFAIGAYTAANIYADYQDFNYPNFAGRFSEKTEMVISEIAAGIAYQLTPALKIGSAVRMVSLKADLTTLTNTSTFLLNPKFNDLSIEQVMGFKFGIQYKFNKQTQMGISYRSQVDLEAHGWMSGNTADGNAQLPMTESSVTVNTIFPQQASLGVLHRWNSHWKSGFEVDWTEYSQVKEIGILSSINSAHINTQASAIKLNWADQWNVRLGGEFNGLRFPLRFGYVYTSQVNNTDWAQAAFDPPAPSHTFTLGSSYPVVKDVLLEGGAEYTISNGNAGQGDTIDVRPGEYSLATSALHLGFTYIF